MSRGDRLHLRATVALGSLLLLPPAARADDDAKAAAREHFASGVAAFEAKRFGEAADEFTSAYQLFPAYVVLYNIGQVDVALGRSVEAVAAFNRYLHDGGGAIPPQRRAEVEEQLRKELARVGSVTVRTRPGGAEVRIDGRLVGKSPLPAPIPVTAGRHTVEGLLAGRPTALSEVEVAGRATMDVELVIDEPGAVAALAPPGLASARQDAGNGPARSPGWRRASGYALLGAGLATGAVGATLTVQGARQANDAAGKYVQDRSQATRYADGMGVRRTGIVLAAAGGAALLTGLALLIAMPSAGGHATVGLWAPRSWGVSIAGAF